MKLHGMSRFTKFFLTVIGIGLMGYLHSAGVVDAVTPNYTGQVYVGLNGVNYGISGITLRQRNHWNTCGIWNSPPCLHCSVPPGGYRETVTDTSGNYLFPGGGGVCVAEFACGSGKIAYSPLRAPIAEELPVELRHCTSGYYRALGFPIKYIKGLCTPDEYHVDLGETLPGPIVWWNFENDGTNPFVDFEWVPENCSVCGDGIIDLSAGEVCDEGINNTDTCGYGLTCCHTAIDADACTWFDGLTGNLPTGKIGAHGDPDPRTIYISKGTDQYFHAEGNESIPADQDYLRAYWREEGVTGWNQIGGNWECVDDDNDPTCTHAGHPDYGIGIHKVFDTTGEFQVTLNVFDKIAPDGPKCSGNPDCGDAGYGMVANCPGNPGWFDCDPYNTGPDTNDEDLLTVVVTDCGNGTTELGEDCDDGNSSNTDACLNTCKDATCGDDYEWVGVEECDDGSGNAANGVCTMFCTLTFCGDGTRQNPNGKGINLGDPGFFEDCDGEAGCGADCKIEADAWFRTRRGDVYSSGGVIRENIAEDVGSDELKLSSYLCLKTTGTFQPAGGCTQQPSPSSWIFNSIGTSIVTSATSEFNKLIEKLESISTYSSIPGGAISGNLIVYSTENIVIDSNIEYSGSCSNEKDCSLLIVVNGGNVTVRENVEHIDAFIITNGEFIVESDGDDEPLVIDGGVVALGDGAIVAVTLERDTITANGNLEASEEIRYDPRYIDILRDILGKFGQVLFSESGI